VPSNDTVTLAINGEVSLDDFAQAIPALKSLIAAIQNEKARDADLHWVIDDLQYSSAITRLRGVGEMADAVADEYLQIGRAAAAGRVPDSAPIRNSLIALTGFIGRNGSTSVRLETREDDAEILHPLSEHMAKTTAGESEIELPSSTFGSVRGRVQSITNRKTLQFTIYDVNTDGAISCYLEPGSETLMRKAWGKLAIVSGLVRRNQITGEPSTVRHIKPENIKLIEEASGSWRDAIGASRSRKGEITSDVAIRRGRDGQGPD
jgi:hypothetical protein